jgi:hypothetical protein
MQNTFSTISMNMVKKKETMEIFKIMNKGHIMDSCEKYYIYKYSKTGACLNEQHITTSNMLFDILQGRKLGST